MGGTFTSTPPQLQRSFAIQWNEFVPYNHGTESLRSTTRPLEAWPSVGQMNNCFSTSELLSRERSAPSSSSGTIREGPVEGDKTEC